MSALQSEFIRLIKLPAQDPSSSPEIATIWLMVFIVGITAIVFTGKSMKGALAYSYPRALAVWGICFSSMIAGMTAVNLYLLPHINNPNAQKAAPAVVLLIILLVLAAPACRWIHKTKYSSALFTITVCLVCSLAAVYIVRGGFNAARTGKASAIKSKTQTESVRDILKDGKK